MFIKNIKIKNDWKKYKNEWWKLRTWKLRIKEVNKFIEY